MNKKKKVIYQSRKATQKRLPLLFIIVFLFFLSPLFVFPLVFKGKIFPGVYVNSTYVGELTPAEAAVKLSRETSPGKALVLASGEDSRFEIPLQQISFSYDFQKTTNSAYLLGRTGNVLYNIKKIVHLLSQGETLGLEVNLDEKKLEEYVSVISGQTGTEPTEPSISVVKSEIKVDSGKPGEKVDKTILRAEIAKALAYNEFTAIKIPLATVDHTLTPAESENARQKAEKLLGKNITLTFEYSSFTLEDNRLVSFIEPKGGYILKELDKEVETLAKKIDRSPQDAKFFFDGAKVKGFAPSRDGIKTESSVLREKIIRALDTLSETEETKISFEIPVKSTPAQIKNEQVNTLGIKELIGRGKSQFRGSIASRIYNVNLAATRLNGILIKPDETFSFNAALGDVSSLTGYKQAYIIQEGKTVLGDGGGVCQVSTTLFRAVLDAGLPIVERRAHSYRVGYYEQDEPAGIDATVFSPTTDFKFKNDTGNHILIQSYPDTKNTTLVFELYGTSDGRKAAITKPIITDQSPPPEALYIDDPALPAGTVKQIDWAAWGAKARFTYTVTRLGETIYKKTFYSSYQPWQAKYLRGTGPAQ